MSYPVGVHPGLPIFSGIARGGFSTRHSPVWFKRKGNRWMLPKLQENCRFCRVFCTADTENNGKLWVTCARFCVGQPISNCARSTVRTLPDHCMFPNTNQCDRKFRCFLFNLLPIVRAPLYDCTMTTPDQPVRQPEPTWRRILVLTT